MKNICYWAAAMALNHNKTSFGRDVPLTETVIQLCAKAESREGAKERGSRVRTNKDSRKGAGREGQTRHSHCHSAQKGHW